MWRRSLILAACFALAPSTANAAGASATFPFNDAKYLQPGEKEGGLVHRTDATATGALPIVVYLHGTNEKGPLHRGLGSSGFDLRKTVSAIDVESMLVAGPSTTRDAWTGSRLWPDFDLTAFIDAVDAALPSSTHVDRSRVVLAGHSGAGCNLKGGLLADSTIEPLALLAIDTCLDGEFGAAFGRAADRGPVEVFWQESWPRDVAAFEASFTATLKEDGARRGTIDRLDVPGSTPHEDIVPLVLSRALPRLLASD